MSLTLDDMPDPTDPPRPAFRKSVNDYLSACVWSQQSGRLETTTGAPVYAWLNQTGTPTITATVQWEAGDDDDVGNAVPATVSYNAWDLIKNGTFDLQTGLVSYQGKSYRFQFEMDNGTPSMKPYSG